MADQDARRFHLLRHDHGPDGLVVADGIRHEQCWTFDFPDGPERMPPGWCELKWRGAEASWSLWPSVDVLMWAHCHDGTTDLVWED